MTTLATALSKAISSNLLSNLPNALAAEFGVEADAAKTFLGQFLADQLPAKAGKSASRTPAPKGTNGKGRTSGYIMFSNANRQSVMDASAGEVFYKQRKTDQKDADGHPVYEDVLDESGSRVVAEKIPFPEVGRRLGQMWKDLSDEERADWVQRAVRLNEENGLPTPTPSAARAKKAASAGAAPKRAAGAAGGAKKSASAPKAATSNASGPAIKRHLESKAWVVEGTQFVVQSPKNKAVVGKLRGNKVVNLSAADRKECESRGWTCQEPAAKKAPAKKAAGKRAAASEASEDAGAAGSEEAGSGDE